MAKFEYPDCAYFDNKSSRPSEPLTVEAYRVDGTEDQALRERWPTGGNVYAIGKVKPWSFKPEDQAFAPKPRMRWAVENGGKSFAEDGDWIVFSKGLPTKYTDEDFKKRFTKCSLPKPPSESVTH